jgi:dienelactone hydrolase
MRRIVRIGLPVALAAVGTLLGGHYLLPRLAALAFIVRVAKQEGPWARLARLTAEKVEEGPVFDIATRYGPMNARLYRTQRPARRTTLLVPGVHMDGVHEARLVGLARELAASGLQVLTVAPPGLARYRITPDSADALEDAVLWASAQPNLARDGRVGLMGISFSGGLALVAAGRAQAKDHVAFVLSFGGHGDLPRVLRYLCQGQSEVPPADARTLAVGGENIHVAKPHDYGAVVTLLNVAKQAVPADQVATLEQAVTAFLRASSIDRLDPAAAAAAFAQARELGQSLPEPARALMTYVNDRDVLRLGQSLATLLPGLDLSTALSPERSPLPSAPVFLLHGADDSVVPASEMLFLVRKLRPTTRVRAMASRLITHAEVNRSAAVAEMWRLSAFWQELLTR